jgi:DNA-binding CsgD family transcriptional regulator
MLMHGAAGTNGTLAALADLSIRERDALSALARGLETAQAATEMKISPRAFSKLISQARAKLKSKTTNEAIYKASALNALVFL